MCSWFHEHSTGLTGRPKGGLVICELRNGELLKIELGCELGLWLGVTSHACNSRFANYRTGFARFAQRQLRIFVSVPILNADNSLTLLQWRYMIVKCAYFVWKTADDVDRKLSKLIQCLSKLQLAKVGAYFGQCISTHPWCCKSL